MSKHTPGPWEVKRAAEPESTTEFYFTSKNGVIGYWKGGKQRHTDDKWLLTEADANLIAAAPGLLEALQDSIMALEIVYPNGSPVLNAARAAIARARGES